MKSIKGRALEIILAAGVIVSSGFVFNNGMNSLKRDIERNNTIEKIAEEVYSNPLLLARYPYLLGNEEYIEELRRMQTQMLSEIGQYKAEIKVIEAEIAEIARLKAQIMRYQSMIEEEIEIRKQSKEISGYIMNYLEKNEEKIIKSIKILPDANCAFRDRG